MADMITLIIAQIIRYLILSGIPWLVLRIFEVDIPYKFAIVFTFIVDVLVQLMLIINQRMESKRLNND